MRDALRLLREKQAESRLQELRDLLAEGISSGEAKPWNKDAFLNNVRARWQMKEIELTPKAEEDLEAIWGYSFRQFGIVQADAYISRIAAVFNVLAMHDIGTHRAELGDNICSLPVEQHMIYFVPSHSVVTVIRILSQSQDTARHEPRI